MTEGSETMTMTRERMMAIAVAVVLALVAIVWFVTHGGGGGDSKHSASPTSATSTSASASPTDEASEPNIAPSTSNTPAAPDPSNRSESAASASASANAEQPLPANAAQVKTASTYADLTSNQNATDRSAWFASMKSVTTPEYYAKTYAGSENQTLSPIQSAKAQAWASANASSPAPSVVADSIKVYPVTDIPATATSAAYQVSYMTYMPGADSDGKVGGQKSNPTQTYTVFMKKSGDHWLVDNVTPVGG